MKPAFQAPAATTDRAPNDAPTLRVHLLGGFYVVVGDRAVDDGAWRLRKARGLVKLLALAPGHRLHREQLIDALWPNLEPEATANALRYALHRARRVLADAAPGSEAALRWQGDLLALQPAGPLWVDVEAFEVAANAAQRTRTVATYRAALDLYTGSLLPEDRYEDWAIGRREALHETHLALLIELAELHERAEDWPSAIAALDVAVVAEPTQSEAHTGLMRLYALAGQRDQALRQYRRLQQALRQELDVEPDPDSQRLYRDILAKRFPASESLPDLPSQRGHSRSSSPTGKLPVAPPARHNLPAPLTTFVGREREVEEIRAHLERGNGNAERGIWSGDGVAPDLSPALIPRSAFPLPRLVTLVGAGGVGKTRLMLAVATGVVAAYPDGVWLVELAGLTDTDLVPGAVATALVLREQPGRAQADALADYLRNRRLLLVLDNCEHLIDTCARLAAVLLAACPGLTILATSREALHIPGELVWRVPSLRLPDPLRLPALEHLTTVDAVRLFCDRARFARSGFALTEQNAQAVAEICLRLDGIPLAIELAAARVALLAPEQLAARLGNALGVLTSGSRTAPSRQQTLRATLDWSHALLTPAEQVFLRHLAVFAGSWTVEAAEDVASDTDALALLAGLVDKSLVQVQEYEERLGEVRYRLLETVRQYAWEQLTASGAAETARQRQATYYLAVAEQTAAALRSPRQISWLNRLEAELDNLRGVLAWAFESGQAELGLRLAAALGPFWQYHGHLSEGRVWLGRGLAAGATSAAVRARALSLAGWLARFQDEWATAMALLNEGLTLYAALGDQRAVADTVDSLGDVAYFSGDQERAGALHRENLARRRALGDRWGVAMSLNSLGWVALAEGELEEAATCLAEALALVEALEDRRGIAMVLGSQGLVALDRRDGAAATTALSASLRHFDELGNRIDIALSLAGLAAAAGLQGRDAPAARLYGAAERQGERNDIDLGGIFWQRHYAPHLAAARSRLGEAAWAASLTAGRALSQEEAVAEALSAEAALPAALPAVPAAQSPASGDLAALSPREREVVALLTRGDTNAQIAAALGMAPRTADTHVSNILRKLGLASRTEVAAWATSRER